MMVDAVLPAGGRVKGELASLAGTDLKALMRFGGETVLERTLTTLRATGLAHRIIVVGPQEAVAHVADLADAVLPETDSGAGNVLRGTEWLGRVDATGGAGRVLVLTTDLPFLTPEAITRFVEACPPQMDLCVPVLNRQEFEADFPHSEKRYVRLRDGEWMIGCAMLMRPLALLRNRLMIERAFAARRSQLGMARLLGPLFVLRFLTRRLRVAEVEAKCLHILGCTGAGIRGCAPELAFDIDYLSDYRYAAERCERRALVAPPRR
jgi:CTP:molybdopterin cytidylyltransferase MocA